MQANLRPGKDVLDTLLASQRCGACRRPLTTALAYLLSCPFPSVRPGEVYAHANLWCNRCHCWRKRYLYPPRHSQGWTLSTS